MGLDYKAARYSNMGGRFWCPKSLDHYTGHNCYMSILRYILSWAFCAQFHEHGRNEFNSGDPN